MIEAVDLAGGKPLALTYGPANFFPTDVLRDGRILFEAAYPLGARSHSGNLHRVFRWQRSRVVSLRSRHTRVTPARQVSSGDIVFASHRGLARFTSARAQEVRISAPAGEYAGDVAETPAGDWLLSWRAGRESSVSTDALDSGFYRTALVTDGARCMTQFSRC